LNDQPGILDRASGDETHNIRLGRSITLALILAIAASDESLPRAEGFRVSYPLGSQLTFETKASGNIPNDYFSLDFPQAHLNADFNDGDRYGPVPGGGNAWLAPASALVIFTGQVLVWGPLPQSGTFVAKIMKNANADKAHYVCTGAKSGVGTCPKGNNADVCTGIGHLTGNPEVAVIQIACEALAQRGDTFRLAVNLDTAGGHDCGEQCTVHIDTHPAHTFFSGQIQYSPTIGRGHLHSHFLM